MVGRRVSFWEGLFSGATLSSGSNITIPVGPGKPVISRVKFYSILGVSSNSITNLCAFFKATMLLWMAPSTYPWNEHICWQVLLWRKKLSSPRAWNNFQVHINVSLSCKSRITLPFEVPTTFTKNKTSASWAGPKNYFSEFRIFTKIQCFFHGQFQETQWKHLNFMLSTSTLLMKTSPSWRSPMIFRIFHSFLLGFNKNKTYFKLESFNHLYPW